MGYKKQDISEMKSYQVGFVDLDSPHVQYNIFTPRYEPPRFYSATEKEFMTDVRYGKVEIGYDKNMKAFSSNVREEFPIHYINLWPVDMPTDGAFEHVKPGRQKKGDHPKIHDIIEREIKLAQKKVVEKHDKKTKKKLEFTKEIKIKWKAKK